MSWEMQEMRQRWRNLIKLRISKERRSLRNEMEEYADTIFRSQDGELAAVGTYTRRWVDRLKKNKEMTEDELRSIKKLMKTVAQGARGMMRTYTRACQDKLLNKEKDKKHRAVEASAELRQLGIKEFVKNIGEKELVPKIRKQKKKILPENECAPPMDALKEIERGGIGLVSWER
jgi:hypothetical protein